MLHVRRWAAMMALGLLFACSREDAANTDAVSAVTASKAIGVPECDDYLQKYESCLVRAVPARTRQQLAQEVADARVVWRELSSDPSARPGLALGCKRALETAKETMEAYDCAW